MCLNYSSHPQIWPLRMRRTVLLAMPYCGVNEVQVAGDDAQNWDAVRRDSLTTVNGGQLIEANEETGFVSWKDRAGETKTVTLGAHAIKLTLKSSYYR